MAEVQVNDILNKNIEIQYRMPKFIHRILANLIDILVCGLLFLALFIGTRAIVESTPSYKEAHEKYVNSCLKSTLYVMDDNGKLQDIITFLDNSTTHSAKGKMNVARSSIENFYVYMSFILEDEPYRELTDVYNAYLLDEKLCPSDVGELQGNPFFIEDHGIIIRNPVYEDYPGINQKYYTECYKPYIEQVAFNQFQSCCKEYIININYVNNLLLFIAVPTALILSGFLTWFVPPLFFRRGRQTLGKALYHIGIIDQRYLNVTFKRWLARFAIFFFGEFILSIFTFGVPYFVSISMMAFTKGKQGFPDYMLQIFEVDTSNNKIYFDEEEVKFENINKYKEPVDFKMEDIEY